MITNSRFPSSQRPITALALAGVLLIASLLPAQERGKWIPISQQVTSQVKPGYPGKTAGVAVDPATGDVFMVVPDQGIWKSTNHGKTFARVDDNSIGGRCETGFALNFDPAGKRLMCFMIYGGSALTQDGGETWAPTKTSHLDFGAVDWDDSGKCFLSLRHENGGMLCLSTDEGQTWKDLGKGFAAVGLFDSKTLVCRKEKGKGLVRSTDGGATWEAVSDITSSGFVMRTLKGVGYWCTEKGLLVSEDKGKTWAIRGTAVNAVFGPHWGKDPKHLVVIGKDGFHESADGGDTWKLAAPLPPEFGVGPVGPNYAWDPIADIFYASSMGKDTFKFER